MVKLKLFDDTPLEIGSVRKFIEGCRSCEFRIGNHIRVPSEPGVYLFKDYDGPLYVGKSNDLYKRYSEHMHGSHNKLLSNRLNLPLSEIVFDWMPLALNEIDSLERALIRVLNPLYNKIRYGGM
ncbi:MAG: GIY-YIG nuclease family protein [Chloroflexota bacterium]|nr:GIY-YIG nuclease family protein [Chloroflexota bacterium]